MANGQGQQPQKPSPQQVNLQQRQAVLSTAVEMKQQIFTQTYATPSANPQINIPIRNVGLIKYFIIELAFTVANTAAAALTLTDLGIANILSSVIFTDLNNNVRVNAPGWLLAMIANAKKRSPYAGGFTLSAVTNDGNEGMMCNSGVWPVLIAPANIPISTNQAIRAVFKVPLAYSDDDLRGAMYANVVNATAQLQLNLNTNFIVGAGVDQTLAGYAGNAAATLTNLTVTVYQVYLDQLPMTKSGVILPMLDLSTVYELKSTSVTGAVAAQDFPYPYANFRDFLSTTAVYVNAAAGTRTVGTDINYWALQSANFTNLWKIDPLLAAQEARELLHVDLPPGVYHFNHRRKPISTSQYGNMELIVNPSVAAAGAYLLVGVEDFALVNTLTAAGSLAG